MSQNLAVPGRKLTSYYVRSSRRISTTRIVYPLEEAGRNVGFPAFAANQEHSNAHSGKRVVIQSSFQQHRDENSADLVVRRESRAC